MADWNTVRYDPAYGEPLDAEIIPLCDAMNAAGFVTTSSCWGHGTRWPHVWFEHSTDERIERMARFVLRATEGEFRPFYVMFEKDIRLEGYAWSLAIHLNETYGDTPSDVFMAEAVIAINRVTELVCDFAAGKEPK